MKVSNLFSLAAVLVAVVMAFAFKPVAVSNTSPNLVAWFQYEGPGTQTDLEITTSSNYKYRSAAGTCSGSGNVCAVEYDYTGALSEGKTPSAFSNAFKDKILNDRNDTESHAEVTELP